MSALAHFCFSFLQRVLIYEVPQAPQDHLGHQVSISGILGDRGLKALREEAKTLLSGAESALSSAVPLPHSLLQDLPSQAHQDPKAPQVR